MKNTYLWASVHAPSEEQLESLNGDVVMLKDHNPELQEQLNNIEIDTVLARVAVNLIETAEELDAVLVQPGGSPAFQYKLGKIMNQVEVEKPIYYSYSKRVSEDIQQADGSVKKVSVFAHLGWVTV